MVSQQQLVITDRIFFVFTGIVFVLAVLTGLITIAVTTATIVVITYAVIRLSSAYEHPALRFVRYWYQPITYTFFYEASCSLSHVLIPHNIDPFFQRLDLLVFRSHPSVWMAQVVHGRGIAEFMFMSYFSYYLLIPILGFVLYFRDRERFPEFILWVSSVFYVCYVLFMFLPVIGPETMGVKPPAAYLFHHVMAFIYRYGEVGGGSFPSSHVAVALTVTLFAARVRPRLFKLFYLPDVIFLSISTVYLRYHYLIDVFAGVVTAIGVIALVRALTRNSCETSTAES